ncbi:MAG: hypothetical protein OXM54_12865 [Acidimicrobiaceae bacterium]|nr:hypothetical protein [Acidimicrobiaceae bacterium]
MTFAADVELVNRVNAVTLDWRQGDVPQLTVPSLAWFATSTMPLTPTSARMPGNDFGAVVAKAKHVVIVTQTCDIVRDCREYAHITLAGVVTLTGNMVQEASRGRRPRYVALPDLGSDCFADTSLLVSAEKSILLGTDRISAVESDASRRRFAEGIGRAFERSALPDDLVVALNGLTQRIKQKYGKHSKEGRALRLLEDIRIRGFPSWTADEIDVRVLFCPPTQHEADDCMAPEEWDDMIKEWIARATPHGVIRSIQGDWLPFDMMTARDYLDTDCLDLEYLSSRPGGT